MASNPSFAQRAQLASETRKRFVADAGRAMAEVSAAVQERLLALMSEAAPMREMQVRRDAWDFYQRARTPWLDGTLKQWQKALLPPTATASIRLDADALQLVGTEVVENKILASRLVLGVVEKVIAELDDLRVRMKLLEGNKELESHDVLRPEVLILQMVEQWAVAGMQRDTWPLVHDTVQRLLTERLKKAYEQCNEFLIKQGVLPTIELSDRVKRIPSAEQPPRGIHRAPGQTPEHDPSAGGSISAQGAGHSGFANQGHQGSSGHSGANSSLGHTSDHGSAPSTGRPDRPFSGRLGWAGDAPDSQGASGASSSNGAPSHQHAASAYGNASEETRMLTSTTPLARARSRAQGVMGQLKRLLIGRIGSDAESSTTSPASPALAAALAVRPVRDTDGYGDGGTVLEDHSPAGIARVAGRLREETNELKKKAEGKSEKATIEIVALMFQAILQEERIPPGIRVWFARLQMPVLRVALEEPDFFSTLNHPARELIDRMGSCVMGFDASGIQGAAMEAEVKRVVQVIEQYPETGKRVYQLVYDEFQKFLAKFLTEKGSTQKVVSVAQQVEQKETLTIQYTIEMRNMLKDVPVRDEIREFLFKVWAEVLAVAAVRKGPQHVDTLDLKKSSTDLVWAASAKPNRSDRAKVIADLPRLLQRLRTGMTLLGLPPSEQDRHLKTVSDTLADAFLSKTQAIPQAQIEAMAKRLANLEDFVSEDGMGDIPLDGDSIEIMLGIDASTLDVVADGGSKPSVAMVAWANELQLGAWFTLDHSRRVTRVQFAWRSERRHLNLFASSDGHSYLIQAGRLAAYLQAGLLLPEEEETLTVRATRDALAKLEANPERLLG
jgi:hypothetical protein